MNKKNIIKKVASFDVYKSLEQIIASHITKTKKIYHSEEQVVILTVQDEYC